jgi:hypothetical protein
MELTKIYTWIYGYRDNGIYYTENDVEFWVNEKEFYVNNDQVDVYLFCNSAPKEWSIKAQKL